MVLRGKQSNMPTEETLDPKIVKVLRAIRDVETGAESDPYNAYGDEGASYGAYQWNNGKAGKLKKGQLPANFVSAAKKYGLDSSDFSPVNQNKVAYYQIKEYKDKGYQPDEIAALWNGAHVDKSSGRYTYNNPKYGEKFRAALGKDPSSSSSQMASSGSGIPGVMTAEAASGGSSYQKSGMEKTGDVVNSIFPGKVLGEAAGANVRGLIALAKGDMETFNQEADFVGNIGPRRLLGDAVSAMTLPVSMAMSGGAGLVKNIAQFAGINALGAGGSAAAKDRSATEIGTSALQGGAIGGAFGGVFNLAGKALSKGGAPLLSFTSGVPKAAIEQAAENPAAAKIGTKMSVEKIRNQAVKSLSSLYRDLSDEFEQGLNAIKSTTGQTKAGMTYNDKGFIQSANKMRGSLTEYARDFAREFRLGTKKTPDGVNIDFSKSPIVKGGEKANVQEAFTTISTWRDFSARGMQDLARRIGALRNFESGVKTESSAIISKIYNKITGAGGVGKGGLIPNAYPELATIRTNFESHKTVLDEISNVMSADKKTPVQVQSSITRLSNLYKEDKEAYVRAIGELSKRSGVDYLSLLAGTEFQKVLPSFVRGLGGAGVVGVGASLLNPYLILLAPLFSPRFAGVVARNATKVRDTASAITRGVTNQATPEIQGN